jgi:hypothetical protein
VLKVIGRYAVFNAPIYCKNSNKNKQAHKIYCLVEVALLVIYL